jgi:hypothetical protein
MPIIAPANKLAEFMAEPDTDRRERIVRDARKKATSHPIYYQSFHKPAREFLISGGTNASGILRAISRLESRMQTPWRESDSEVTIEALRSLISLGPELHRFGAAFVSPGGRAANLQMPDLEIAVPPNLLLHGQRHSRPLVGALRFYLKKQSALGAHGAEMIAVMEYLWLQQVATEARIPDLSLCIVVECMQRHVTMAPSSPARHISAIERASREFARIWRNLDAETTPKAAR